MTKLKKLILPVLLLIVGAGAGIAAENLIRSTWTFSGPFPIREISAFRNIRCAAVMDALTAVGSSRLTPPGTYSSTVRKIEIEFGEIVLIDEKQITYQNALDKFYGVSPTPFKVMEKTDSLLTAISSTESITQILTLLPKAGVASVVMIGQSPSTSSFETSYTFYRCF